MMGAVGGLFGGWREPDGPASAGLPNSLVEALIKSGSILISSPVGDFESMFERLLLCCRGFLPKLDSSLSLSAREAVEGECSDLLLRWPFSFRCPLGNDVLRRGRGDLLVAALSEALLDEVDVGLRIRLWRELAAPGLVFAPVKSASFAEAGLAARGGGVALDAREVSGLLGSLPLAFHVCGFLALRLLAAAALPGMRFVGTGIFSSDPVLKRVTISLKLGLPAGLWRATGDDTFRTGGACL